MSFFSKLAGAGSEGDRNLDLVRPILVDDFETIEASYNLVRTF